MSQLDKFDGGLNTRIAPHLLNVSEGQKYLNVDNSYEDLRPLKEDIDTEYNIKKYFTNFKDSWVSSDNYVTYQQFQNKLYISGNYKNTGDLSLDPNENFSLLVLDGGALNGTFAYRYTIYDIVTGAESSPSPVLTTPNISNSKVIVHLRGLLTPGAPGGSGSRRDPRYAYRLYRKSSDNGDFRLLKVLSDITQDYVDNLVPGNYIEGDSIGSAPIPLKTTDGTTFYNLGIYRPLGAPDVVSQTQVANAAATAIEAPKNTVKGSVLSGETSNFINGKHHLIYTYYDSTNDVESLASPDYWFIWDGPQHSSCYRGIHIQNFVASNDPNVDKIRFYMSNPNDESSYGLIATLDNSNNVSFDILSSDIGSPIYSSDPAVSSSSYKTVKYQYCYTYYNDNDGTESMPSDFSDLVTTTKNPMQIDVDVYRSPDPQVTNIKLYRLGGDLTEMTLVALLTNEDQTFSDTLQDVDIAGTVLDSYTNGQAPRGLKYITEHNSMLFGSIGSKLWYSEVAFVDYWSPYNFIDFPSTITGIGTISNGLLVFTSFTTYIVTGNSPKTLSKYLLSSAQGCLYHKSIQYIDNKAIWLSTDGVCTTSGGSIRVISLDKLRVDTIPLYNFKSAIVHDSVYYASFDTKTLAMDTRYGNIFREIDLVADDMSIYKDILYYSKDNTLHEYGLNSTVRSLTYRTPRLALGSISNLKNYKNIYIKVFGTLTFKIYIDSELVATKTVSDSAYELLIPQSKRLGYYMEIEITGTGNLAELQYIAQRRQNGR